jgi:hypothetical protein
MCAHNHFQDDFSLTQDPEGSSGTQHVLSELYFPRREDTLLHYAAAGDWRTPRSNYFATTKLLLSFPGIEADVMSKVL